MSRIPTPGNSLAALLLTAIALLAGACQEARSPSPLKPVKTPIPERSSPPTRSVEEPAAQPVEETPAIKGENEPAVARYSTPGSLRWKLTMDDIITAMRMTPLAGLLVSVGPEVHNVTSRGQQRWRYIAGKDHRSFDIEGQEIVWSPQFGRLTQLIRWGRHGWHRSWSADLVDDGRSGFLLVDAAIVASVGPDGKDRWRAALDGPRRLEGPFSCSQGNLFHGIRGLEGTAITLSHRGSIVRETDLARGSLVLGASPDCNPLVWNGSDMGLLDARGLYVWRRPMPTTPLVVRGEAGYLLASARPDKPVHIVAIDFGGNVAWETDLPVKGRLTALSTPGGALTPATIALCMDVSSPCSKPGGTRGPYNAVVIASTNHSFTILERHIQGHLNLTPYPGGGTVFASSSNENKTVLVRRTDSNAVVWETTLPGRLTAGPYVGPEGEVYVATCDGWDCMRPFTLYSVTRTEPAE